MDEKRLTQWSLGSVESDPRPAGVSHDPADSGTLTTVLLASNIHCASCVAFVKEVLAFLPSIEDLDVSIVTQEVRIRHGLELATSDLAAALIDAAFEVHHATTYNGAGLIIVEIDTSSWTSYSNRFVSSSLLPTPGSPKPWQDRGQIASAKRRHIENCDVCRWEELAKLRIEDSQPNEIYREKWQYAGSKPLYEKRDSGDVTQGTLFPSVVQETAACQIAYPSRDHSPVKPNSGRQCQIAKQSRLRQKGHTRLRSSMLALAYLE